MPRGWLLRTARMMAVTCSSAGFERLPWVSGKTGTVRLGITPFM